MIYLNHVKIYIAFGLKLIMCLFATVCSAQAVAHTANTLVCLLGPFWNKPISSLSDKNFFPDDGKPGVENSLGFRTTLAKESHSMQALHCLTEVNHSVFYKFL